ncbi:MAG: sulfur carrier protein ThiS [Proteobacteria bacterium]|nr:sulfur carrier protein ThiS [Pseudomonadota bacterium]
MQPDTDLQGPTAGAATTAVRRLELNGTEVHSAALTLQALLLERGLDPTQRAFACALNGVFVPRARWAAQSLRGNDRVDIVAPVVGG